MPKPIYSFKTRRMISVSFKEVFTTRIIQININPCHTIRQMIEIIRPQLSVHFGINEDEIEIVESGQNNYGLELPSEAAPSLVPSSVKVGDIWGQNLQQLSFYVRIKNYIYPEIENWRRHHQIENGIRYPQIENLRRQTNRENNIVSSDDCPICLESSVLIMRYSCIHGVCDTCYSRCQSASISSCSLCRAH